MARPSLLYISPVIPQLTGNGLAMRAGTVLEILARRYRVTLLVVTHYAPYTNVVPESLARHCEHITVVTPSTPIPHLSPEGGRWRRKSHFDVIHVFRLGMLPVVGPYRNGAHRPSLHLDLDDVESMVHSQVADLYRANGSLSQAVLEEQKADQAQRREDQALLSVDRVYVCSSRDRAQLLPKTEAEVTVLPNAIRLPPAAPARSPDPVFAFLFVGTLGYYPNEDAVRFFCTRVIPLLRPKVTLPFVVLVAGMSLPGALRDLEAIPEVQIIGPVPDLQPWYGRAGAVLAPIRAGGGTRIKVLEAFAQHRPVIATSLGAAGIEAHHGEHLLIGDTPEELAEQCARIMTDPALANRLAEKAGALVRERYTIDAVARMLGLFGTRCSGPVDSGRRGS